MKLLAIFASLLFASTALATTTSCQTGSLSAYLASGFSCQSGTLIFTDFEYQGTGSDASSITVKPLTASDEEGFQIPRRMERPFHQRCFHFGGFANHLYG